VKIEKLASVDAFVVFDLDEAETAQGIVRQAPKVLVDGATWLARSQTYQFASFDLKIGGASAGVNAPAPDRAAAVQGFVTEVAPLVASRRLLVDPGKGVTEADLAALRSDDPRDPLLFEHRAELCALGQTEAAVVASGGSLEGRTVAIEGFDGVSVLLAEELTRRGASVVCVGTASGTATAAQGFEAEVLAKGWDEHGAALTAQLGPEPTGAREVLTNGADILFVGSKAGVIDHAVATGVTSRLVVPNGPIPVTAKALAVLRRRDVVVLPDFITTSGALFAAFPPEGRALEEVREALRRRIPDALAEVLDHEDGPLLGACHRAESFLRTWCPHLPFGRPLA
jgi:glutamate dehydrogenase (NAD(P)+)